MVEIIKASKSDLAIIVPLFDQYRIFYGQESNIKAAEKFLIDRFRLNECTVFIAKYENKAAGFTLLYKTFSSVSMRPYYVLNDLYVNTDYRQKGIGQLLLEKAQAYCRSKNYKGLALETAIDNPAQRLYEKLGWKKDSHCFHYFWQAE